MSRLTQVLFVFLGLAGSGTAHAQDASPDEMEFVEGDDGYEVYDYAYASAAAGAPLLICGLTEADVDSTLAWYGSTDTYQDVAQTLLAPFDCSQYGDLCRELGTGRGESWTCNRWNDMKAHLPESTVYTNAATDFEVKQKAWFDVRYPTGVPDQDVFWSIFPSSDVEVLSSSTKLKHTSWAVPTPLVGIGSTLIFLERTPNVGWFEDDSVSVSITSTFRSDRMFGGSPCLAAPATKSGMGTVVHQKWGKRIGGLMGTVHNRVQATGTSGLGGSTFVEVTGTWWYTGCI